jgi:hypothetical protein
VTRWRRGVVYALFFVGKGGGMIRIPWFLWGFYRESLSSLFCRVVV